MYQQITLTQPGGAKYMYRVRSINDGDGSTAEYGGLIRQPRRALFGGQIRLGTRDVISHSPFDEEKKLKIRFRVSILPLLLAIIVLIIFLAPWIFSEPSYDNMALECSARCNKNGRFGTMVKREGPYSPKPSAQIFDCVCT